MIRLNEQNINSPKLFNEKFDGKLGVTDLERFEKLAKYYEGGIYADVGCWDSPMPLLLAERSPKNTIYALDFSDKVINTFASRIKKVKYELIPSCLTLPFEDESVDYVVGGEIIEHLDDPSLFVAEARRVLKKGGWLAISTPHIEAEKHYKVGGATHMWSFDEQDLKNLGFTEIEVLKEENYLTWLAWQQK